jgi:HK97 gp10 family phage protein
MLLQRVDKTLRGPILAKAAAAGATVVKDEALVRAPVGPLPHHEGTKKFPVGYAKSLITVAKNEEQTLEGAHATYMATWLKGAWYLRYYEYGRSKQAAQPFFRPAIEATRRKVAEAIEAVITRELKSAGLIK